MSKNLFANLDLGTPGTPGTSTDTSSFGRRKSLIIAGPSNLNVDIQFSHDDTNWSTLRSIKSKPDKQRLDNVAKFMRVSIPAGAPAPTNIDIAGTEDGTALATLTVPSGIGVGASVAVSDLGSFNTFAAGGLASGDELVLESSEDNVSFEPCLTANFRL